MRNYFCVNSSFIRTQKFRNLHDSAGMLYFEFLSFADDLGVVENPGAIMNMFRREKKDYDELIAAKLIIDITFPNGDDGLLLITDFNNHNPNLKFRKSKYSIYLKNYCLLENKENSASVVTSYQEEVEEEVEVKSQNLNIITSDEDVNTESAENEALRHSQNINTEHKIVNTESALELFKNEFSEAEIIHAYEVFKKYQRKNLIKDDMKYFRTILVNAACSKKQHKPKASIPEICVGCDVSLCVKPGKFEVYTNGINTKPCPYAAQRR